MPRRKSSLAGIGCFLVSILVLLCVAAILVGLGTLFLVPEGPDLFQSGPGVALLEIREEMVDERAILKNIETLADDPNTRALVVRVDSPGGVITVVEEVYNALKRVSEEDQLPIVASMGTLAASGGYFVCLPADQIFADATSLTGSIGVIVEYPTAKGLLDKLGVEFDQVKSGEFKGAGSLAEPLTDAQRALMQAVVDEMQMFFVQAVSTERGLAPETVAAIADGRVLTGRQAVELGLADEIGDLHAAVQAAGALAGIEGEPRLIEVREEMPFLSRVFGQIESVAATVRRTGPTPKYVLR